LEQVKCAAAPGQASPAAALDTARRAAEAQNSPARGRYLSTAPPIYPTLDISEIEATIALTLINRHAA
jgi:hypothetical protein